MFDLGCKDTAIKKISAINPSYVFDFEKIFILPSQHPKTGKTHRGL